MQDKKIISWLEGGLEDTIQQHINEAKIILLPSNTILFTLDLLGSSMSYGDYVSLGCHQVNGLFCDLDFMSQLFDKCSIFQAVVVSTDFDPCQFEKEWQYWDVETNKDPAKVRNYVCPT